MFCLKKENNDISRVKLYYPQQKYKDIIIIPGSTA